MTTVVGIQGDGYCLLAADTRITSTDSAGVPYQIMTLKSETSKIAVNGKYLIATAGDLRAINLLTHTLNPPICPPNIKGKKLDEFVTNKLIPAIKEMFEKNGYTTNETMVATKRRLLLVHRPNRNLHPRHRSTLRTRCTTQHAYPPKPCSSQEASHQSLSHSIQI